MDGMVLPLVTIHGEATKGSKQHVITAYRIEDELVCKISFNVTAYVYKRADKTQT